MLALSRAGNPLYSAEPCADQFQRFADPNRRTPVGVAVETGKPLIGDTSDCWTARCMITPGQLAGAVWSVYRVRLNGRNR
jgi:hypothetical protein